jgi:predicted alpha-1,2-mannosidase
MKPILIATLLLIATPAFAEDPVGLVNPFIGTWGNPSDGPSDTFPGADAPFGMIQWSPDTPSQPAGGGYLYTDQQITGFSVTHLSGPGCSAFGDIGILPTLGPININARQNFSHVTEDASPGYYAVDLSQPPIRTRFAVTTRTGIANFTFPATTQANVLINASSNQAGVAGASVRFVSDRELVGSATSGWFCGMPGSYTVYFVLRFDRSFIGFGTWLGKVAALSLGSATGTRAGAWATFDTTREPTVKLQVAISFVGIGGAMANLGSEATTWDVDAVRRATAAAWQKELGRVRVSGGTRVQRRIFYTALYHALLHPNVYSDADGRYTGFDGRVHLVEPGHTEYATFSGWDIYRTQTSLVAFVDPARASDMARSLLHAAQQSGWLPKWPLVNAESAVMGGDSADPIIAGIYAFGGRDFDVRAALTAMIKGALYDSGPGGQGWYRQRPGLSEYEQRGYVVNDHTTNVAPVPNGASLTLEYALDDFSIAQLAWAQGDQPIYRLMMTRAQNWANLFDRSTGWIAPRDRDGAFMHTPISVNGQSGFQEGNAAQYTWMVPQNYRALIAGMGGAAAANAKLDDFFAELDAGQNQPYAWLGNEPTIGAPWVYLSTGAPWKAQRVVRAAMTTLWGDSPDGIPGNDDLGTMSAWYVWCAMGLYPQNPATGILDIGAPLFSRVTISLPDSPGVTVVAPRASTSDAYVQSVRVNGRAWAKSWVAFDPRRPMRLDFALGAVPNVSWAAASSDEPPSYELGPVHFPPSTLAEFSTDSAPLDLAPGGSADISFSLTNPAGAPAETVNWRLQLPAGLGARPSGGAAPVISGQAVGRSSLASGQSLRFTYRVAAASQVRPALYDAAVLGTTATGAAIERVTKVIRVSSRAQTLPLAYVTAFFDNAIVPVDPQTLAFGVPITVAQFPRDLAVSPDGKRAYVAGEAENRVTVVDLTAGAVVTSVGVGSGPWGVRVTPDGRTVWVANNGDDTVQPIDTATLSAGPPIKVGVAPGDLAISPDGTTLYVADQNSDDVTPVDLRQRLARPPIPVGARPRGLALTPNGKILFVSNMGSNSVIPIDTADGRVLPAIPVGVAPRGLAVSPDGRWLYVSNFGTDDVTPIDVSTLRPSNPIRVGLNPTAVAFTADGSRALVAESGDNNCAVVNVATQTVLGYIAVGTRPTAVAWSP